MEEQDARIQYGNEFVDAVHAEAMRRTSIADCPTNNRILHECQISSGQHDIAKSFPFDLIEFLDSNPRPGAAGKEFATGNEPGFDPRNWDWSDIENLVAAGYVTDQEIDDIIHRALR